MQKVILYHCAASPPEEVAADVFCEQILCCLMALQQLLKNTIFVAQITHQTQLYPGFSFLNQTTEHQKRKKKKNTDNNGKQAPSSLFFSEEECRVGFASLALYLTPSLLNNHDCNLKKQ